MPKGVYPRVPRPACPYPVGLVEKVREAYLDHGMSMVEVAKHIGVGVKVLQRLMPRHGIARRPAIIRNQRGAANANWKEKNGCYTTFHNRVRSLYGKPKKCTACGTTDQRRSYDWANISGRYDDPSDYKRLCQSCHRKLDQAHLNFTKGGGVPNA